MLSRIHGIIFLDMKKYLFLFFVVMTLWTPVMVTAATTGSTFSTSVAPLPASPDGGTDGEVSGRDGSGSLAVYERALVEGVKTETRGDRVGGQQMEVYTVRFLSGTFNGQTQEIAGDVGSNPYGLQPRVGDKVVVFIQSDGGSSHFYLEGYDRRWPLIWLTVLFVAVLVLLSGWQGIKVVFSIGISIACIGFILVPAYLKGVNPVPVAIVLSGILTWVATGLSSGWNKRAFVTAIGTMGGALVAYGVAALFAHWAHLNGVSSEEDRLFFDKNPLLQPQGLLFAGIIIAATGVVEDVAVSIVSAVAEVKRANPRVGFRSLFLSGMIVGRDHMSALANTLVFAYVGASLSTLLLYSQFGGSWLKFFNFDSVVDEVIRSLAGTIGLVFTVPMTALLIAWVVQHERRSHVGHDHVDSVSESE